ALRDFLVGAEHARLPQQRVDEGGLAVVDVGDDGEVAQIRARGHHDLRGEACMLPTTPYPSGRMTVAIAINPDAATERHQLDDESWVDVTRGWMRGADELYRGLVESVPWQQGRVFRYERYVDEPRMGHWYGRDTPYPHAALTAAHRAIQHQYRVTFGGVGLAWYRDGRDSVAFHRDTDLRYCENTVIAILSLGAQRPWLLQPRGSADRFRTDYGGKAGGPSPPRGDPPVKGGRAPTHRRPPGRTGSRPPRDP